LAIVSSAGGQRKFGGDELPIRESDAARFGVISLGFPATGAAMPSSFIHGVLVWYLISLNLWARAQPKAATNIVPGQNRRVASLTPQQRTGLKMLQTAEVEAKSLPAPMRAYLLLEIASCYSEINPARERSLRFQAFQSTLSIEDDDENKEYIQEEILQELLYNSEADLEKALPKAMLSLRNIYAAELAAEYAKTKRYDRALELIRQVAADGQFPYHAAATLMLYLPEDRAGERQEIFSEALAGYLASTEPEGVHFEDIGTMVVRFWDKLPPAVIMEATDRVLDHAKQEAEAGHRGFNFSSSHGSASFGSTYELRLFQLLPVIRNLDPSRAEQLLRDNPKMKSMLEQYPQGMQSLDGTITGTPRPKGEHSDIFMISRGPLPEFDPQAAQRSADVEKQRKAIYELARRDPKRALRSALALPGGRETRADTLVTVGEIVGERDSSIAKTALTEALKLSADFDPVFRIQVLKDATDVCLQLKDQDAALKTVAEGNVLAQQLYVKDADSTSQNLALKAQWPSTNFWREFVGLAARVSPDEATKLIDDVPDPEIHAFLRVALASSLMGQEPRMVHPVIRNQEHEITAVW
jgi:hypothetical protein